jgi:hypothetical protein
MPIAPKPVPACVQIGFGGRFARSGLGVPRRCHGVALHFVRRGCQAWHLTSRRSRRGSPDRSALTAAACKARRACQPGLIQSSCQTLFPIFQPTSILVPPPVRASAAFLAPPPPAGLWPERQRSTCDSSIASSMVVGLQAEAGSGPDGGSAVPNALDRPAEPSDEAHRSVRSFTLKETHSASRQGHSLTARAWIDWPRRSDGAAGVLRGCSYRSPCTRSTARLRGAAAPIAAQAPRRAELDSTGAGRAMPLHPARPRGLQTDGSRQTGTACVEELSPA